MMEEKVDKTDITVSKTEKSYLFQKGKSGNPAGRPPGSGYKQKWDKAVTELAKEKGITKDQADMELFKVAYEQALKGNFQFFKDAMDRVYGPVRTETMMNVENLENLTIVLDKED